MLMYFSRAYSTGFFQINFTHRFFQISTGELYVLQWKPGGRGTERENVVVNTEIVSSGRRRNLLHRSSPRSMGRISNHEFVVDEDRCFGCAACIALCPVQVLTLSDRMIYVDEPNCTHCRLCIPSCPVFALDIVPA